MRKVLSFIILLCSIAVFVIILAFERTQIPKKGTISISGMKENTKVYFDEFGIPHIDAQNANDAYHALGYVMASERLFQIDLLRRLVSGRLSEIFGEKALPIDILSRKLKFKKSEEQFLSKHPESLSKEMIAQVESFIQGVDDFVKNEALPIEFVLLGYTPDRLELADIMGLSSYMAMGFSEGMYSDILFSELMEILPEEKMKILRTGDTSDDFYFKEEKKIKLKILDEIQQTYNKVNDYLPLFHGSNSWVLSGKRTTSGLPILANDPHIKTSNPHIFYEAHLRYPGFEVYGDFIPLSPFPVIGHTTYSAWGLTMAEVDDVTIYSEKHNPNDPSLVMFKNEWVPLKESSEIIKVKGKADYKLKMFESNHGVLLDDTKYGIEGKSLALTWSAHHPENNASRTFYELPKAKNVDEFKNALSHAGAPGLNVTWVSRDGDIAWWVMGKYPKLPDGVPYDVVLNGWDGQSEIERYYDINENPHAVNPKSGQIVSANYRPASNEFSHFHGYWQPGGRFFRLESLISQKEKWDLVDLMKVQNDNIVPIYKEFKEQFNLGLKKESLSEFEIKVLDLLNDWNGNTELDSIGATIFFECAYQIAKNIFYDELGEKNFNLFSKSADHWHAFKKLMFNLDHPFWDNIKTNRVESGAEVLTESFKIAIASLEKRYGSSISHWKWGKVHQVKYVHPLSRKWPLNLLFDIGPIPAKGGRFVINNLGHQKLSNDFAVVHGPATRRLIDMKSPEVSFGILPTGNSANPFSPNFDDQLVKYHRGEYRLQLMNWKTIENITPLVFTPQKSE